MDKPGPVTNPGVNRPRPVVPPSPLPSKTALLRDAVEAMQRLSCLETTPGAVVQTGPVRVDHHNGRTLIRDPDPLAMHTTISNPGPFSARVYEGGVLVGFVLANGQDLHLKERGRLKLEAESSFFCYLTVTTHQRAACGDVVAFLAPDSEPVGSFLL